MILFHSEKHALRAFFIALLLITPALGGVSRRQHRQHRRQKVLIPVVEDKRVEPKENDLFWSRFLEEVSMSMPPPSSPPTPVASVCTPTKGPCVSSQRNLEAALELPDQVVTLCGETTIQTAKAVSISKPNLTLCCASQNCVLQSLGTDRNLYVTGTDVTLQGIRFVGGNVSDDSSSTGGNVAIDAAGYHTIADCVFSKGKSDYLGGNLYVKTSGSVFVTGTVFDSGQVRYGGGGLSVVDARRVEIVDSFLVDNVAGSDGGGFIIFGGGQEFDQNVRIYNTSFVRNEATYGGGFLATSFGQMPRLDVQLSTFNDNVAEEGAAAAVLHSVVSGVGPLELTLRENVGSGNVASSFCEGFLVWPDCLNVSQSYPL